MEFTLSHLLRRVFDGTPEEEAGALVTAASEGDVEKCLKLLQPSNAASDKGSRDLKLVQPVAASAIINAKVDGHTALHLAARNGHSKGEFQDQAVDEWSVIRVLPMLYDLQAAIPMPPAEARAILKSKL